MGSEINTKSAMNSEAAPSPNARIAMSFDQGAFEHPVHGSVKISGKIPLLLASGIYTQPPITKNKEKLDTLIKQVAVEFRPIWEKESDETVEKKSRDLVLFAAYVNPMDELSMTFVALIVFASAIDDILSITPDLPLTYPEMIQKMGFLINLFEKVDSRHGSDKIGSVTSKFLKQCEEVIPDFWDKCHELKQEWNNTLSSYALLKCRRESGDEFSDTSKNFFGSCVSALNPILEFIAVIRNLTISDEIRSDILFQRMKSSYGSASQLMKDVFGLGRNLQGGQGQKVNDSAIWTQVITEGEPLQIAFEKILEELCAEISDIKLSAAKVREIYWDDEDLQDYIECLERALDGQFYWCQQTSCYENLNLNIVTL